VIRFLRNAALTSALVVGACQAAGHPTVTLEPNVTTVAPARCGWATPGPDGAEVLARGPACLTLGGYLEGDTDRPWTPMASAPAGHLEARLHRGPSDAWVWRTGKSGKLAEALVLGLTLGGWVRD
jgi:hypothetical protein